MMLQLLSREGRYVICRCSCGALTKLRSDSFNRGTKSCGCARVIAMRSIGKKNGTHGLSRTAEYRSWSAMRARCENPKNNKYKEYGGAGVVVCSRWIIFENFLADMRQKPSANHTLDRYPNPAGNYEPGNCRWATSFQQRHNRRTR